MAAPTMPHVAPSGLTCTEETGKSRETSGTVKKAFALLDALRAAGCAMRMSDLSRRTELTKPTVHRLLAILLDTGLVMRVGTHYQATLDAGLGMVRSLGVEKRGLAALAPYLTDLHRRTGLTASLAVLHGATAVFPHRVHAHHSPWTTSDDTGTNRAEHCAAGKLLLANDEVAARNMTMTQPGLVAELARIKSVRHATHTSGGVACLAVLMRPGIALTVKGHAGRFDPANALHWLRSVAAVASATIPTQAARTDQAR
jgi:IclR family acetate operon transcriptional repressor